MAEITGENIESLGIYHPYWSYTDSGEKIRNPKFDGFSGKVLDLKNQLPEAEKYFVQKLKQVVKNSPVICVVPSHDPEKFASGIRDLASQLMQAKLVADGTKCLIRHKKIPKLASGGNRSVKVHKESIRVEKVEMIKGNDVFLLDDVTTSGNSLIACGELLLASGARSVRCLALGKTTR